jgi:membrane peptidoglycan carboxypeptidase
MDSIKYYAKILNTGMMTLDPFNGHIKVWVGGINNKYFKYDHVNQAKRQAGSTFKPFAYLAALESGMNPCDKFTDEAVRIPYTFKGKRNTGNLKIQITVSREGRCPYAGLWVNQSIQLQLKLPKKLVLKML